jgi:2,3-bisphosphoglycerate-independent phosphoglycerate mutase
MSDKQTRALLIFDGFGHRTDGADNAINQARTPCLNQLWDHYPHTLLAASGSAVGLPDGQMGNSEVGHLNLGAGRVVYQDLTRIDQAIESGAFSTNAVLCESIDQAIANDKAIHILGLLSPGGVHSHEQQLFAMIQLAASRGATKLYCHAILDGRDTPPKSALSSLEKLDDVFTDCSNGRTASIIGRFYAMDRDQRWERIEPAYQLYTQASSPFKADSATDALNAAYARGESDEFVQATSIGDAVSFQDGDAVFFMNFRADRARQLTRSLTALDFNGFKRNVTPKVNFVCLTEYDANFKTPVAFKPLSLANTLGEVLSTQGKTQLRLAETEKYAHVTFFFNGGVETPFEGETRKLVASPKVKTYDLKPDMSADELTDRLIDAIESKQYDVIICNYANADMVGHTGDMAATITAIETLDRCTDRIVSTLKQCGGEALITADHGNADVMFDEMTGQAHTAHTTNPVPLMYIGNQATAFKSQGALSDVAPTLLALLGLDKPKEMTGENLLEMKTS